ncbi:SIT4 phosphatase-associated protein-domain-containing protein [Umbelopsis sp. PMI_123]|nr:SIT4 phosphatase-associated protein-domain-containing protein [Umbelopsis sp. PMI_123]
MFWRFGFNNPSAIDAILDKEDVDLQEILNEGDVIQEVKTHNQRLIEFLCQRQNLAQLLQYLTAETLDREQWSYPLIASEILSSDIPQILDSLLIDHVDLLKDLWDFLDKPAISAESNGMPFDLASNFAKVNCSLLAKRSEPMLAFVQSLPNVFQKIMAHLETPAITDLLLTLIRMEEVLPEDNSSINWLHEQGLLDNLVNKLDPNLDPDEHSIAQQVISEIIRMSQTSIPESPSIGTNVLITTLTSEKKMTQLVNYMLDKDASNSTSSLINGVAIIIDLIRHNNSDTELDQIAMYSAEEGGVTEPPVSLKEMMQVLADRVGDFNNLLINPKSVSSTIPTTIGDRMPLGFERLKICELFAELLHCSNMAHLNKPLSKHQIAGTSYGNTISSPSEEAEESQPELATESVQESAGKDDEDKDEHMYIADHFKLQFINHLVLPTCLDIFFGFPWNNFLHYVVYDMLHQIFNGSMEFGYNRQLALSVLKDGKLTNRIIEAYELNELEMSTPKGMRLGYMGHLTFIADEISKLMDNYSEVEATVRDDVDLQKWDSFYIEVLAETRERDTLPLGGDRPSAGVAYSISEEEEDDEDALVGAQDEFARYMHHAKGGYEDEDDDIGDSGDHWMSQSDNADIGAGFDRLRIRNDNDPEETEESSQPWSSFPQTTIIQQTEDEDEDEYDRFSDRPGFGSFDVKNRVEGAQGGYQSFAQPNTSAAEASFVPAVKTREEEIEYKYQGDDDDEQEGEI